MITKIPKTVRQRGRQQAELQKQATVLSTYNLYEKGILRSILYVLRGGRFKYVERDFPSLAWKKPFFTRQLENIPIFEINALAERGLFSNAVWNEFHATKWVGDVPGYEAQVITKEIAGVQKTICYYNQMMGNDEVIDVLADTTGNIVGFVDIRNDITMVNEEYEGFTSLSAWRDPKNMVSSNLFPYGYQTLEIPCRDGHTLKARLWTPQDGMDTHPVIVLMTPYGIGNAMNPLDGGTDDGWDSHFHWVVRGYAYIEVCCSRGQSWWDEPELIDATPNEEWNPFAIHEKHDSIDAINWIADQQWCGDIALFGPSYEAHLPMYALHANNPKVKVAVLQGTWGNLHTDMPYRNGAFVSNTAMFFFMMSGLFPENWHEIIMHRPISEQDEFANGAALPIWKFVTQHQTPDTEDLKALNFSASFANGEITHQPALFFMTGWGCSGLDETIALWHIAQDVLQYRDARLFIGPWLHEENKARAINQFYFGKNAMLQDRAVYYHKIFDHYLLGKANGIDEVPPVQYYDLGKQCWKASELWPPVSQRVLYQLASSGRAAQVMTDGILSESPVNGAAYDQFIYDPQNPSITAAFTWESFADDVDFLDAPIDDTDRDMRQDSAVFRTEVFTEPTTLAGRVSAVLSISADVDDTDVYGTLKVVRPDGQAMRLAEGLLRLRYRKGFSDDPYLYKNESYDDPEPLSGNLDDVYLAHLELGDIAYQIQPGEYLRFTVANSNVFWSYPHSNYYGDESAQTETRPATIRLHHSNDHASWLMLPIVR